MTRLFNLSDKLARWAQIAGLALGIALLLGNSAMAGPVVFWASDPVAVGDAAMLLGEGLGPQPVVEIERLRDDRGAAPERTQSVEVLQPNAQSLKFVLPSSLKPGVFAVRVVVAGETTTLLMNRPAAWWAQGDLGTAASPGGWVRAFGKNFVLGNDPARRSTTFYLRGPKTLMLRAEADAFAAKATLPADLPVGEYQLQLHNGFGGADGWSKPVTLTVAQSKPWPQKQFNVRDFGAIGDGKKDDTGAIQAALAEAEQAGGGVVLLPRGRYRVSDCLTIPRQTVLRGAGRQLTALCWTDFDNPPEALVEGTHSFGLEDFTLYAHNHRHVIAGETQNLDEAGNVFLHRVCVRADAYRSHLKPEEVDRRFRESLKLSTGGGDSVRLAGPNVEITDCDIYGSGRALFLNHVRGGRVAGCHFYNGRWGWYSLSGNDGLIFEDNSISGADLMSTGGGMNCLGSCPFSQNVYYARNRLSFTHGWDREAMTSDAGGELYFGKVASVDDRTLVLAEQPKPARRSPVGMGVFLFDGKGAGQYRRVVNVEGNRVEMDRPFTVAPDQTTTVGITAFQGHYMLIDNTFTDTGAMQFYGTSIECLVVNNRGTRMKGFAGQGRWYHGFQPSWFCQFLGNQIAEGNYYHWNSAQEAALEVAGFVHAPYDGPMNRGSVVRGNLLEGNAHIRVVGRCRDVIVEDNRVENADQGIFVSGKSNDVLVRNNEFEGVELEMVNEEAIRLAAIAKLKRFMGRQEPIAIWDFEKLGRDRFVDESRNGFAAKIEGGVKQVDGGIHGHAAKFDGAGYLRVDDPAVFNAPEMTVSLWVKPETVSGRRGLVSKRYLGCGCPFVVSQTQGKIHFEAAEANGPWSFNFDAPSVLEKDEWVHVTAVAAQGQGVVLYVNGQEVARKENKAVRATNYEPLILGREAWGGDPPDAKTPGFFVGLMDEVKIWTRALTAEEVRKEFADQQPATADRP